MLLRRKKIKTLSPLVFWLISQLIALHCGCHSKLIYNIKEKCKDVVQYFLVS